MFLYKGNPLIMTDGFLVSGLQCMSFAAYLCGGHVGDGAVGLDALELLEAPVQLLKGLQRQPSMVLLCKDLKRNSVQT